MSKWYEVNIEPRDTLFFRGAKPMGASAIGEGASWPVPAVFHQALLSAFHARWPMLQDWEHGHTRGAEKNTASSCRFGGLQTVGVFPECNGELYFPMPSDVQCASNDSTALCVLEPRTPEGTGNLPAPLEKSLFKPGEATKKTPPQWISTADLQRYLKGEQIEDTGRRAIFDAEPRPGIGIDAANGTTEDGQFYLAENLRLRPDISLKAFATCEQVRYRDAGEPDDVLGRFFDGRYAAFVYGGQRGVAHLEAVRDSGSVRQMLDPVAPEGRLIKWVTLTPSIFIGGWLPGWIDPVSGTIRSMETEKPPRKPGESRHEWRSRFKRQAIPGRLVAASVPKPLPWSGWRDHGGTGNRGARPTRLCVPAGAVYYFEVPDGESPGSLVGFLNGRRNSDMGAEKGFGFGLCGTWK